RRAFSARRCPGAGLFRADRAARPDRLPRTPGVQRGRRPARRRPCRGRLHHPAARRGQRPHRAALRRHPRARPGWSSWNHAGAAVEETRRAGLTIAAHGHGTAGIRNAAQAGVDTIEHCTWLGPEGTLLEFDEEVVETMVQNGVHVVPTMTPVKLGTLIDPATLSAGGRVSISIRPQVLGFPRRMREMGVRFAAGT